MRKGFLDLSGERFGKLLVVSKSTYRKSSAIFWDCVCECGQHILVCTADLNRGKSKSCGDKSHKTKISSELREKILGAYSRGISSIKTSKMFGVSSDSIIRICRESGIEIRSYKSSSHRLGVDHNFFEVIDTEDKAYWLGFICADGNVYKNLIRVSLKLSDKEHLEKLKTSLKSEHVLLEEKKYNRCSLSFRSDKISKDLHKYGITENKSLTLEIKDEYVSNHLQKHFWRGVLDGDGYLSKSDFTLSLCGTYDVIYKFSKFIKTNNKLRQQDKDKNHYRVDVHGSFARIVVEDLYKDSHIFLERKYRLAERMFL